MPTLNHNLSAGDTVLIETQLNARNAMMQFSYTGILATTVKIEVRIRAGSDLPWVLVDDATLTINPALTSDYIKVVNPSFEFIQIKLVTGGATAGTINIVDFVK